MQTKLNKLIETYTDAWFDCLTKSNKTNGNKEALNYAFNRVAELAVEEYKKQQSQNIESMRQGCVVRSLGIADSIGSLRDKIKDYPDSISFGFRNQSMQELHEVAYSDQVFVVFQSNE